MGFFTGLINRFRKKNQSGSLVVTGRRSRADDSFSAVAPISLIGRKFRDYQNKDLTEIRSYTHENIIKVIRAISPETSSAITTFLRTFESGHSIVVKKKNTEINKNARELLLKTLSRLGQPSEEGFSLPKDINSLASKLALDALFKGAVAAEIVFDEKMSADTLHYIDPWSLTFARNKDGRYVPQQHQDGKQVVLDYANVIYIPVDPMGDDPYGEEQISSAIQPILFKAMVMQDLQRAIHVNGWDRLGFKVLEEAISKNLPPSVRSPIEKRDYVTNVLSEIRADYENIEPDANIVHTDSMEVEQIRTGQGAMFNPKPLLDVIDNQIANGLKTFSVLLSKKFGGGSEGFTSAEMVLYIKIIGGFQKIVEKLYGRAFEMILRYEHGIIATVDFKFKKPELRTDEEMAQWKAVTLSNIALAFNEQSIGLEEKQTLIRTLLELKGKAPDDIAEERIVGNKPNEPERPSSAEDEKEDKRSETNRDRRSGRGK